MPLATSTNETNSSKKEIAELVPCHVMTAFPRDAVLWPTTQGPDVSHCHPGNSDLPARMPAAVFKPPKRVLGDSTNTQRNVNSALPSPKSAKRRKLDNGSSPSKLKLSQNGPSSKFGSSQPKSQFEEEVLEKLTQDVGGLKKKNAEKDQQWERPGLDDFDENTDSLCFQQIEIEEGTLPGGKTTLKLFGVTEVGQPRDWRIHINPVPDWSFGPSACHRLSPLSLHCCSGVLHKARLRKLSNLPRLSVGYTSAGDKIRTDGSSREFDEVSRQSKESVPQNYGDRSKAHQQSPFDARKRRKRPRVQGLMEGNRQRNSDL